MQYPSERASACEAKELQLFVEITCCDLLRFEHSADSSTAPEQVQIAQEFYLGAPGAHADMQVRAPGIEPYFVEVKYGYTPERLHRVDGPKVRAQGGSPASVQDTGGHRCELGGKLEEYRI